MEALRTFQETEPNSMPSFLRNVQPRDVATLMNLGVTKVHN